MRDWLSNSAVEMGKLVGEGKDLKAQLAGFQKDVADFKQKLDVAATTFDTALKIKDDADHQEKEEWRTQIKADLTEFEGREHELADLLKAKETAFAALPVNASISDRTALSAEIEGLKKEQKEAIENADRARASADEIAQSDAKEAEADKMKAKMEERMRVDKAKGREMKTAWDLVDTLAKQLKDTKKKIDETMVNIKNIKDKTLKEENYESLSKLRDANRKLNANHKAAVAAANKLKEGFESMMAARA